MVWSFYHSAVLLSIGSEDREEATGGVSHTVLSDFLVPVLDETSEGSLHEEASSAVLQDNAVKVSFCILLEYLSVA